ncbi:zinc finger protein 2 homolog [Trichoplusia ni]|uniref:Zinc finger protein 2 homolog n=1 Tax=Trichoplusia ni TaxID=7111 RepID=A0A7E5WGR6_TRINI|nr:zinc finger protein 2 homolog [Trichoplusia ni]
MADLGILNLNTLCRCCHSDGSFKSLESLVKKRNAEETYETMLRDTLGITIYIPPLEASYTICEKCITKLRAATNFKKQVALCEEKFMEYCKNEQFLNQECKVEIKSEPSIQETDNNDDTQMENYNENTLDFKEEPKEDVDYYLEVDMPEASDDTDEQTADLENQENTIKETQDNTVVKKNENKSQEYEIDTSCIIETESENGLKYSCRDCGGNYTEKQIHQHLFTNHDTLECKICKKILKNVNSYKCHVKLHGNRSFKCNTCDKTYPTKHALKHHINTHTREKVFTCDYCNKTFLGRTVLRKHILFHLGLNKKKLCDLCGWSFNDSSNLRSHVRSVHLKLRPFVCNTCGKTFKAKKHLKDHQFKHGTGSKRFFCDKCDKKYSTCTSLKIHRLKHDNVFKCSKCPLTFESQASLTMHLKQSHSRYYPCDVCNNVMSSQKSLNRHKRNHAGLKYPCDICNEFFSEKSVVSRHKRRVHNNEKKDTNVKTKCSVCGKLFMNILNHMRSHNNRQSSCDLCDKSYPDNSTLNRHKLQKHFSRLFDCEICGKKYIQKDKLKKHQNKVHNLKLERNQDSSETSG